MELDYATHKAIAALSADCGDVVVNRQDKTIRTLGDRILLCHLRDLHVKKPSAHAFPESKSVITAPTETQNALSQELGKNLLKPEHKN